MMVSWSLLEAQCGEMTMERDLPWKDAAALATTQRFAAPAVGAFSWRPLLLEGGFQELSCRCSLAFGLLPPASSVCDQGSSGISVKAGTFT